MSFRDFYKKSLIEELFNSDIEIKWDDEGYNLISATFNAPNKHHYTIEFKNIKEDFMIKFSLKNYIDGCKQNSIKPNEKIINLITSMYLWDFRFFDTRQEEISLYSDDHDLKSGHDLLKTGGSAFVFSAVIKVIKEALSKYPKIKLLSFAADYPSRISLYNNLVKKFISNSEWDFQNFSFKEGDLSGTTVWYVYKN
jgi:hypothetical protein